MHCSYTQFSQFKDRFLYEIFSLISYQNIELFVTVPVYLTDEQCLKVVEVYCGKGNINKLEVLGLFDKLGMARNARLSRLPCSKLLSMVGRHLLNHDYVTCAGDEFGIENLKRVK